MSETPADAVPTPIPVPVDTTPDPMAGFSLEKTMAALSKSKITDLRVDVTKDTQALIGVVPTGHSAFDAATGIGGIPRGVITEMYGAEGVGKSTIALMVAAKMQQLKYGVLWLDQEFTFDPSYARKFGMIVDDPKKLWLSRPDNIEDAFTIAGAAIDNGFRGLVVYDSLGAGQPRVVMDENAMGETRPGIKSAVISTCIEQIYPSVARSQTTVIFINQLRSNIVIQNRFSGQQRMDNAEVGDESSISTPGGRTLKHYASLRIALRKLHSRQWEEREKKSEIEVTMIKNKLAAPYGKATMVLQFGCGFLPS